jgi:hypothetical protein
MFSSVDLLLARFVVLLCLTVAYLMFLKELRVPLIDILVLSHIGKYFFCCSVMPLILVVGSVWFFFFDVMSRVAYP